MPVTRRDVLNCARSYSGTPFLHHGRLKGKGIDCIGLILCVAEDLALNDLKGIPIRGQDYLQYPEQPTDNSLHREAASRLKRGGSVRDVCPGQVVTMRSPSVTCHIGIVGFLLGQLTLIHVAGNGPPNRCVEHWLSLRWRDRIVGVFDYPEAAWPA